MQRPHHHAALITYRWPAVLSSPGCIMRSGWKTRFSVVFLTLPHKAASTQ